MIIPAHEKRILEAYVRKIPLNELALQTTPLNEYEQEELANFIQLRLQGFPLQYLIGTQAFYGRDFYINTSVLIPRPETEGLVEAALKQIGAPYSEQLRGLELGTGSGCIAISLSLEHPNLHITATEASADALQVAQENIQRFGTSRVQTIQVQSELKYSDYENFLEFDFLISNPPYLVLNDEIAEDVRQHEPPEALFAPENNPYYFYEFLSKLIQNKLKHNGFGIFEIASNRSQETMKIFSQDGLNVTILKDLAGKDRYVLVIKK